MEEVNVVNIDDFIRQEKRLGRMSGLKTFEIAWDKKGWDVLKLFKPNIKAGDMYLGATHKICKKYV